MVVGQSDQGLRDLGERAPRLLRGGVQMAQHRAHPLGINQVLQPGDVVGSMTTLHQCGGHPEQDADPQVDGMRAQRLCRGRLAEQVIAGQGGGITLHLLPEAAREV